MAAKTLVQVEELLDQLTVEEPISLVEHLARRLRQAVQRRPPQDLYGIWRDRFPADFDLDTALDDIRHEWKREWPQVRLRPLPARRRFGVRDRRDRA